jgi:hypothetical protein
MANGKTYVAIRCSHRINDVKQPDTTGEGTSACHLLYASVSSLAVSFLVPAPHPCVRVVPSFWYLVRTATPNEGWMERRQAHSLDLSRVRGATSEPCGAACPVANGTSLGAPPWRFSAGDRRRRLRE